MFDFVNRLQMQSCAAGRWMDRSVIRLLIALSGSRWVRLSAALFHAAVHRMSAPVADAGSEPFNILILTKAMFNEDALATFGHDPRFRLYGVHRQAIKALARSFFPVHVDDNNYANLSPEDEAAKRAYRAYCVRVLRHLVKFRRYDAMLTANYAYYAEREWAAACEAVGIAFVVLHKENIRSPGFAAFMETLYRDRRGPFTGRRVLVYNRLEKEIECRAKVAPATRITVTGMPRMDRCHEHRRRVAASGQPEIPEARILFFSFGVKTLLPGIVRKLSGPPYTRYREAIDPSMDRLGWYQLFDDLHRAMLRLAQENPDIEVVIKSKGVGGDKEAAAITQALKVDRLPDNLHLVFGGDPLREIVRSAAVCGFNTTALLESVAVGVPVVVPRWGEYVDPVMRHYIVDFEDAVDYADHAEALVSRLSEFARRRQPHATELTPAQERMLEQWLFNTDGRAGERVRDAVVAEISNTRKGADGSRRLATSVPSIPVL